MKTYTLLDTKNLSLFSILYAHYYENKENKTIFYDSYKNIISIQQFKIIEQLNSIFDKSYITLIVT